MRPSIIRRFIEDPSSLPLPSAEDQARWSSGLTDVIGPAVAARPPRKVRDDQGRAWEGFAPRACGLLLGPPGTGKTTTLAWMITGYLVTCREAGRPCRVLVTGFTRGAIANLLEGIARALEEIGDRGKAFTVAYLNREQDIDAPGVSVGDVEDAARFLESDQVVIGMTTWGVYRMLEKGFHAGAPGLDAEIFDVACIDEASQMLVDQGLLALAPLKDGGRLLVAGDDRQLPPIGSVDLPESSAQGLGGSIYTFLESKGIPSFPLTVTARLNRPLVQAPAELFYDAYESADHVATRRILLADGWAIGQPEWIRHALDPDNAVCILLHDGPPSSTQNAFEAGVLSQLVAVLKATLLDSKGQAYGDRFWQDGLAVVTPHRAQNTLIRRRLRDAQLADHCVVETVDRIQGRERDAILLSYAVADPEFAQMEAAFLFSPNRFNVAITRPRSKLVIVLSRRLLEVLPAEEEVVDAVRMLREYVFGLSLVEHARIGLTGTEVEVRVLRFSEAGPGLDPRATTEPVEAEEPMPAWTREMEELDKAIRDLAEEQAKQSRYRSTTDYAVARRLARRPDFREYRDLLRLGRLRLDRRTGPHGAFWSLTPVDQPSPLAATPAHLHSVLGEVVRSRRIPDWHSAAYVSIARVRGVREAFVWCDVHGNDVLWSQLLALQHALALDFGHVHYLGADRATLDIHDTRPEVPELPTADVPDEAFRVLNRLEDQESSRIELGIVEGWHTQQELADANAECGELAHLSAADLAGHLATLERHGFVLSAEGRYRSRMAELARELRHVKQRFQEGDTDRRPYLVRSLKVLTLGRDKPVRDTPILDTVNKLQGRLRTPELRRALGALEPTLRAIFDVPVHKSVLFSGFQLRGLEHLVLAWDSDEGEPHGTVITADTGSGKTEAAGLPVLVGAAADRLRGTQGVRAMFVYPRVRLATNQAARLCGYAAELGHQLGITLTVGLQCSGVAGNWRTCDWPDRPLGRRAFPLFKCPSCEDGDLEVSPGGEADTLHCIACGWAFDGWISTQKGLREHPPAIFLIVTESMHQWPSNPVNAKLFGDRLPCAAPRVLVADEIHLYGHIHGAQVGWAMRRVLARWRLNGSQPIAVGMSATLGQASEVWSALSGVPSEAITHIQPRADERSDNPRAREYYYFIQPEVESRGKDVAGASTTIQSLMLLAHGMRRRQGRNGGFRALAFVDSIDKLRRLQSDFSDAEVFQGLAALRTCRYDTATECCAEPRSCGRFKNGECWFFAATDPHQVLASGEAARPGDVLRVASPISSQNNERTEAEISRSDVVWTTSTLEVGYDDPAIALVYQHYAPTNAASFVQRKGRGGRGADDRPISGVTLSAHSPRDAWYFRNPRRLLAGADFRVPLNMGNIFVRRGHVLCTVIDLTARWVAQTGNPVDIGRLPAAVLREADAVVRDLFGEGIYEELETPDLGTYWNRALTGAGPASPSPHLVHEVRRWREAFHGTVPQRLFDPINLPVLTVCAEREEDRDGKPAAQDTDIALALNDCAPGRISRRWSPYRAHWVPVRTGKQRWVRDDWEGRPIDLIHGGGPIDELVPDDARLAAGVPFHPKFFRPTRIRPVSAGEYSNGRFESRFSWSESDRFVHERTGAADPIDRLPVLDKSHGTLLGFVTVAEDQGIAPTRKLVPAMSRLAPEILVHCTRPGTRSAGIRVTQVYWGCDNELVLQSGMKRERAFHRQVFVQDGRVELVGYGMLPEGVRLPVRADILDAFLDVEMESLKAHPARSRWHYGQFLRALLMKHTAGTGLNRFEAAQLADLAILAAAMPSQKDLKDAVQRRDAKRLGRVLGAARDAHLAHHPQMTPARVERLLEKLNDLDRMQAVHDAWAAVLDGKQFRDYLRSSLLLGMLVRFRQDFVLHGLTEPSRVVTHARLPFQFVDHPDDVLTVCERGSGGDGTTRAYVDHLQQAFGAWQEEGFVRCPNAEADRLVETAFARASEHDRWRSRDSRDARWVRELATELGVGADVDPGAMQGVLRLLYDEVRFEGQIFRLLDLFGEVRQVRLDLRQQIGRDPTEWELVSTVVRAAAGGDARLPHWSQLRGSYGRLEEVTEDGPLSPDALLADQVYRFGARLCVDGCLGCLHGPIDILDENLVSAIASRTLLERFHEFVFMGRGDEA